MSDTETVKREPTWLAKVRAGDFAEIPNDLSWATSVELAHLINGYSLAAEIYGDGFEAENDTEHAFAVRQRVSRWLDLPTPWIGTATDLWIALFMAHRGARHRGYPPCRAEQGLLDRLCNSLRYALTQVGPVEREHLVSAMKNAKFP